MITLDVGVEAANVGGEVVGMGNGGGDGGFGAAVEGWEG